MPKVPVHFDILRFYDLQLFYDFWIVKSKFISMWFLSYDSSNVPLWVA